jgi:hypothetical protein
MTYVYAVWAMQREQAQAMHFVLISEPGSAGPLCVLHDARQILFTSSQAILGWRDHCMILCLYAVHALRVGTPIMRPSSYKTLIGSSSNLWTRSGLPSFLFPSNQNTPRENPQHQFRPEYHNRSRG